MVEPIEIFDIVDAEEHVIGQAPRAHCHGNPSLIHRVAHVLVFDEEGRLLLQKRSATKDVQPGKWDTSVGGHLDPGEDYLSAAVREMREELGISETPLTFLYRYPLRNDFESENVATYLASHEGPFTPCLCEIDEVRFWTAADIDAELGSGLFTNNFEEEWGYWLAWSRRYLVPSGSPVALCAGTSFPDLIKHFNTDRDAL